MLRDLRNILRKPDPAVLLLIAFVLLSATVGYAQKRYPYYQGWSSNFFIGSSNFKGDIRNNTNGVLDNTPLSKFFYQDRKFGGGIRIEKRFNNVFSLSGQLMFTQLSGTSDDELLRFDGNVFEYSLLTHFSLSDIVFGYDMYRKWNWYIFAGIGFTESRTWLYSITDGNQVGSNGFNSKRGVFFMHRPMTETVMPVGFGVKYHFYKTMDLSLEYSFHPINTDKLDAYVSDAAKLEGFGYLSVGLNVHFSTPKHWSLRRGLPSYNGKSSDPAIRAYNKQKRVVMTNRSQQRKAAKKRYSGNKKRLKRRKLNLSR